MNKGMYIIGLLLVVPLLSQARQRDSTMSQVEDQLEENYEELDTEELPQQTGQLAHFLEDLASNPVNLNSAGLHDLLQVPGFNLKTSKAVLEYREQKPFETKQELLKVKGIGKATYRRMEPYVTVGSARTRFSEMYSRPEYWLAGSKTDLISRYQQDLQPKRGYRLPDSSGGYLGGPVKYYQRIRLQSNHMSVNITQEKDPGETLKGPAGFDFNSAHIALKDNGKLKDLVVGDYSLSFGQGLVLWSGGAFGKGREVTGTVSKNERGVKAYTSAQETDFFRGVAATYGTDLQLTAFYSMRPRTASVLSGDTTRFPTSNGFHRTDPELSRKNNVHQKVVGGRILLDSKIGLLGASGYYNRFSSYVGKGTSVSDLYDFEGKEHSVLGIDYRGLLGPVLFFGEAGRSENGGYGFVAGLETPLGDDTELAILYRNYGRDFQSFLGSGFGELSSGPQNETGFYVGLKHRFNETYSVSGYADQYHFQAPRFGTSQSTGGFDVLALLEADFSPRLQLYLLARNEIREEEYTVVNSRGREHRLLKEQSRSSFRAQVEYYLGSKVRLRTRTELVSNKAEGEKRESGFLVYQDLRIQLSGKLRIDGRVTVFETDGFDARVYQFESDLLYVLSNVALFDKGQRTYVVLKYEPAEYLEFWLKYGFTVYEDTFVVGSGLNESAGNRRSSIGIQVRLQF